jgi:predicted flap endonuclease-1-like 5' DNA nuclease
MPRARGGKPVTWFTIQSLLIIILAFLLGLLVGWLFWGRQWRKVRFSESDAITTVTTRHEAALKAKEKAITAKDAEIARLTTLMPESSSELAEQHTAALAGRDAEIERLSGLLTAAEAATGSHHGAIADKDALLSGKDAALADRDALLSEREAALADRDAALHARDAEIARLSALVGEAETAVAGHREELAARQAALTEKDAEIQRLSASVNAATAPSTSAIDLNGTVEGSAVETAVAADVPGSDAPAEPAAESTGAHAQASTLIDVAAAEAASAAAEADDLERVEGIGPRIGTALREAGITTFRQLADAEASTLQGALERAGLRFAPSLPTWSRQARLLADGDEAGFVALTESLVAGRDVSGTA